MLAKRVWCLAATGSKRNEGTLPRMIGEDKHNRSK